jgi:hypothetical protein
MFSIEKDLRSLYAITLAAFLILSLKLGALVQYFQQTHHVFLEVNPNAASADWFHLADEVDTAREFMRSLQGQAETRLIKAGQIITLGDEAMPKPQIIKCPPVKKCETKVVTQTAPAATSPSTTNTTINPEPIPAAQVTENNPVADAAVIPPQTKLPEIDTPIEMHEGDKVLLVGDSMMQGLGPHIVSSLSRNNGIDAIDLSRHSTGLAYPRYFDWPETILQQLQTNQYKVLMIFIGANDTWDIVINGRYTSFGNPKWIEVYSERVEKIILTAKAFNVRLIWFGAPPMGREKMVDRVPVLNQIFESNAAKYPGVARYVSTADVLSNDGKTFSKFIELPERGKVLVRSDDGVHFTANGQRLLAKLALSQLVLRPIDKKAQQNQKTAPLQNEPLPIAKVTVTATSSSAQNSSAAIKPELNTDEQTTPENKQ